MCCVRTQYLRRTYSTHAHETKPTGNAAEEDDDDDDDGGLEEDGGDEVCP